jgi:hypothetical protein
VADLQRLLEEHLATPFPAEARGEEYGEVDAVMIDADIYGWCSTAVTSRLREDQRRGLRDARGQLSRSLQFMPTDIRPYYEQLLALAETALAQQGATEQ